MKENEKSYSIMYSKILYDKNMLYDEMQSDWWDYWY